MSHYFHVERASTSFSTPSDLLRRQSPKGISLLHLNFLLIRWDNVCIVFLPQTQKQISHPSGFRIISVFMLLQLQYCPCIFQQGLRLRLEVKWINKEFRGLSRNSQGNHDNMEIRENHELSQSKYTTTGNYVQNIRNHMKQNFTIRLCVSECVSGQVHVQLSTHYCKICGFRLRNS